ncbi:right-handed parallel beta-helix repeat-containing protein [candidate division KSB1 bacterium]
MKRCFFIALLVLIAAPVLGGHTVTVGPSDADIIGTCNKALQLAVDAVSARGGGTVVIKPGTYQMHDSLHLRSHVDVFGEGEGVILKKEPMIQAVLVADCGYACQDVDLGENPGFKVGMGFSMQDDEMNGGWGVTVGTITEVDGNYLRVDVPMVWDYGLRRKAHIKSLYSVVSGAYVEDITLKNIVADGSRETNDYLNGCVGGAIYFRNAKNILIETCVARNWNGDGISFQIDEDVSVIGCKVYNNSGLGIHPGTGSARPVIKGNESYNNDLDGLFLCWRVKNGTIEDNDLHHNKRYGISIGHKDTDNVFTGNLVRENDNAGVYFRREDEPQGGHRNKFYQNTIIDNGGGEDGSGCGVLVEGETHDIVLEDNKIGDTGSGAQKTAVRIADTAWNVTVKNNQITGHSENIDDNSKKGGNVLKPNKVSKEKVKY